MTQPATRFGRQRLLAERPVIPFCGTPSRPMASPRKTITGRGVALLAGDVALALFGLLAAPGVPEAGVTLPRVAS